MSQMAPAEYLPIREITPDFYRVFDDYRQTADDLMAKAGVDKGDCALIIRDGGEWCLTVYDRDEHGKHVVNADRMEVMQHVVRVAA